MPVVLLHGVPETPALWDALRAHLGRTDVRAPAMPGFGCPLPDGFGATKEEYVAWLVGELETYQQSGPVDLVGHDWGGLLVVRLVSTRPDLVRSWATDAAGGGSGAFRWHPLARIWQTPGDGEAWIADALARPPAERASRFVEAGVPRDAAMRMAGWLDDTMGRAILALYRSAVDVGEEWTPAFRDVAAPGLAIVPPDDPFANVERAKAGVAHSGAQLAELPGLGHWWMLQDPGRAADVLTTFWAGLG